MAEYQQFLDEELKKFTHTSSILFQYAFNDTQYNIDQISGALDELNSLQFSLKLVNEQAVGDLLAHCCQLIPLHHEELVGKFCRLISNTVAKQQLVLRHRLLVCVEYLVEGLRVCSSRLRLELLTALAALLYENGSNIVKFHDILLDKSGLLTKWAEAGQDHEVRAAALQCMENICLRLSISENFITEIQQDNCMKAYFNVLYSENSACDSILQCRMLVISLRGIQNVLLATKTCSKECLAQLLSALKVYMLAGLGGKQLASGIPNRLYPTAVSQYDPNPEPEVQEETPQNKTRLPRTTPKKNKKKRAAKEKSQDVNVKEGINQLNISDDSARSSSYSVADNRAPYSGDRSAASSYNPFPIGRMYSSDSDYSGSDLEGSGQAARWRSYTSKVRHCALACFHAAVKASKKRDMFGFWTSFLPDLPTVAGPPQGQTLFTAILKDPSAKGRSAALAVLSAMLEGSKKFLLFAEDKEAQSSAFTPFSVILGYMIREIHRCLLLALVSENSPFTTTQIIKCIAVLIPNVPYHRLKPGLLLKIISQIKPFLGHRDANIRVACLTCLGSVVGLQVQLMEVWQIFQSRDRNTSLNLSTSKEEESRESGYQSGHLEASQHLTPASPESRTPKSGSQTPHILMEDTGRISWILKLCIHNVTPEKNTEDAAANTSSYQPLPVRLESLQLLAVVAKKYFPLIRNHLLKVNSVIQQCLLDSDPSIQLHGSKLLEELGSAILHQMQNELNISDELNEPATEDKQEEVSKVVVKDSQNVKLKTCEAVEFWERQLKGPLPHLLQNQTNHAVRATCCDAISNVGPFVFEELPRPTHMMCITMLLGLTADDDQHVRAAAIRALGVYVTYPCLRDDVSFVADVANAILKTIEEANVNVRITAAWSLGNLSNSLVLNKQGGNDIFIDDFADVLLLKLLYVATIRAQDNDKVRSNAVRALGSLLRYLPQRSYGSSRFVEYLDHAVQALIKNVSAGTMKVRWNACYAVANMFHNELLLHRNLGITNQVQQVICQVVRECKNFKVRINAALALSIPANRECYGNTMEFVHVWDSLLLALEKAEQVTDFAEYRYRTNFTQQVIKTMLHILTVMEEPDLELLGPVLSPKQELLLKHTVAYRKEMINKTETCSLTEDAVRHLEVIKASTLNDKQREVLVLMHKLFTYTEPPPGSPEAAPKKYAFSETYD